MTFDLINSRTYQEHEDYYDKCDRAYADLQKQKGMRCTSTPDADLATITKPKTRLYDGFLVGYGDGMVRWTPDGFESKRDEGEYRRKHIYDEKVKSKGPPVKANSARRRY